MIKYLKSEWKIILPLPFFRKESFMNKEIIGKNIRLYRKQKGQTLRSLSKQIGISYQQLSRIENGAGTSTSTLERIADVLNVSIEKLLQEPEKTKQSIFGETKCFLSEIIQNTMNQKLYSEIIKPVNDIVLQTYLEQISNVMMHKTFIEKYFSSKPELQREKITFSKQELVQFSQELLFHFAALLFELSKIYPEEEEDW